MSLRNTEQHILAQQFPRTQVRSRQRLGSETEIDLAGVELSRHGRGIGLVEPDVDARVFGAERGDHPGHREQGFGGDGDAAVVEAGGVRAEIIY